MSSIKFDLNDLNKVVSEAAAKAGGRNKEDYTKTSYLPKGSHSVSFFFDPDKHIFRDIHFHKFDGNKVKCLCPNQLNYDNKKNPKWAETVQSMKTEWQDRKLTKLPDCEICALNAKVKDLDKEKFGDSKKGRGWKLKLGAQFNSLLYANLYSTSNPGQYWQANEEKGTPYVIIGSKTLKETLVGMLEEYGKKAGSYVVKALNPTLPSPPFTIINNESGINITVIPQDEKPPIVESDTNPPAWWRPLSEVFLKKDFNLEEYETNVETAKKIFEDYKSSLDGNATPASVPQNTDSASSKNSGGELDSFLGSKGIETLSIPADKSISDLELRTKEEIEDPKPLTDTEVKLEDSGELKSDQRLTKMGEIVTLPSFAVERNCWGNFKGSDVLCGGCSVNLECNFEQD